jgi:hypothetical protein
MCLHALGPSGSQELPPDRELGVPESIRWPTETRPGKPTAARPKCRLRQATRAGSLWT